MKVAQTVNSGKETESVQTPIVPEGFTQVLIDVAASQINMESNSQSSASNSTYGASLWFAGYSGKKETTSSAFAELCQSQNTSVRVGMNVAKVGIEREWFNPGIFVLTKDMFNVSTSRVSPIKDYSEITEERLQDMSRSHILPCYPVAMLVAKDVSIQVATSDQLSNTFSATMKSMSHTAAASCFSAVQKVAALPSVLLASTPAQRTRVSTSRLPLLRLSVTICKRHRQTRVPSWTRYPMMKWQQDL